MSEVKQIDYLKEQSYTLYDSDTMPFSNRFLSSLPVKITPKVGRADIPAIPHPIGPANNNKLSPAAMPPPPTVRAPPPNHASAAFVAAAPLNEDIAVEDIFEMGAVAQIKVSTPLQKGTYRLTLDVKYRAAREEILETEPAYIANVTGVTEYSADDKEEYALLRTAIETVEKYIKSNGKGVMKLADSLSKGYNAPVFSDVVANVLPISIERKQEYLETIEVNHRLLMLVKDLHAEVEIVQLEEKIERDVKESFDAAQREYYLREKMRVIREELGDKNSKDKEADDLRERIENLVAPELIKEKLRDELNRYDMIPQASAESSVIRTYIDWLLDIPWGTFSDDEYTIAAAREILDEDHYGLEEVKTRILEFLAVKKLSGKTNGAIICLVGPPGVGKTSLVKSIARSMNREYVKIALGGVRDEAEMRGHRRTYVGAMPGKIIQSLKKAKTMNPVILLDEVDKMASDFRGDPAVLYGKCQQS